MSCPVGFMDSTLGLQMGSKSVSSTAPYRTTASHGMMMRLVINQPSRPLTLSRTSMVPYRVLRRSIPLAPPLTSPHLSSLSFFIVRTSQHPSLTSTHASLFQYLRPPLFSHPFISLRLPPPYCSVPWCLLSPLVIACAP